MHTHIRTYTHTYIHTYTHTHTLTHTHTHTHVHLHTLTYRLVLLPTIGSSNVLRLQLRMKLRQIKSDDEVRKIIIYIYTINPSIILFVCLLCR